MATSVTAEAMLAALAKWGITPKFFKPDWRTHNRNAQQGWGPLYGFVVHNFASDISDDSSLAYLYRGDMSRGMPGPLSQFAITDDGTVWVIGWGAANHTGTVDADLHALVTKDAVSRTAEFKPNTSGSSTSGTVKGGPRYIGVEMTYGAKGPTAAQRATLVKLSTAIAELVGGTGGSVIGHRECTTTRSDPQFVSLTQLRRDVDALLKAGGATTPEPTLTTQGLTVADINSITAQLNEISAAVKGLRSEESGRYVVGTNRHKWLADALASIGAKVGVEVDEASLASQVASALTPAVREAVVAAGQTEAVADAVVAKLGAALNPPA